MRTRSKRTPIKTNKFIDFEYFSYNPITRNFDKSTTKKINLNTTQLTLKSKQIARLPENLGELTNLIKLNLFDNSLTIIPESIGYLTKLKVLQHLLRCMILF